MKGIFYIFKRGAKDLLQGYKEYYWYEEVTSHTIRTTNTDVYGFGSDARPIPESLTDGEILLRDLIIDDYFIYATNDLDHSLIVHSDQHNENTVDVIGQFKENAHATNYGENEVVNDFTSIPTNQEVSKPISFGPLNKTTNDWGSRSNGEAMETKEGSEGSIANSNFVSEEGSNCSIGGAIESKIGGPVGNTASSTFDSGSTTTCSNSSNSSNTSSNISSSSSTNTGDLTKNKAGEYDAFDALGINSDSVINPGGEQGSINVLNLTDQPDQIDYLISRFQGSERIGKSIKKSFMEKENIKDFFLENSGSESMDPSSFWMSIGNKGNSENIELLDKVYNLVKNVVLHPEQKFDTHKLVNIFEDFRSVNSEALPIVHQDFFTFLPSPTMVLVLLFGTGFMCAMHRCTSSDLYCDFNDESKRAEYSQYPGFFANDIHTQSPFRKLTECIYPIFGGEDFLQNNVTINNLCLKNDGQEDVSVNVKYVSAHLFTIMFSHEYLRKRYSSGLLKITGRINHSHPYFPDMVVTDETEETQQALKPYLNEEDYKKLKFSNFLGKIIFQALLDPSAMLEIMHVLRTGF